MSRRTGQARNGRQRASIAALVPVTLRSYPAKPYFVVCGPGLVLENWTYGGCDRRGSLLGNWILPDAEKDADPM